MSLPRLVILLLSGSLLLVTSKRRIHDAGRDEINDPCDGSGTSIATTGFSPKSTSDEGYQPHRNHRKLSAAVRGETYLWHGIPLTQLHRRNDSQHSPPLTSSVHCVGESYSPMGDAWRHRSCHFRNLCWNRGQFFVVESSEERRLRELLEAKSAESKSWITISSLLMPSRSSLSLGSNSMSPWFPAVQAAAAAAASGGESQSTEMYHILPDSVALIPVAMDGFKPTNVLWNVLYPVYTLLSLFELESHKLALVVMRNSKDRADEAIPSLEHFRSAMGGMLVLDGASLKMSGASSSDDVICSKHAVAGLGLRRLQKEISPTEPYRFDTQSSGEGLNLWAFRGFLARHLGFPSSSETASADLPLRVTIPTNAVTSFDQYAAAIGNHFPTHQVQIQPLDFNDRDLARQARILASSHVFVTDVWDNHDMGLITFLPRRSILLLLVADASPKLPQPTSPPPGLHRADWELLHMAGYFQTRLLPQQDTDQSVALMIQTLESALQLTLAE